jgi:predicted GNAT family acetyltransferase
MSTHFVARQIHDAAEFLEISQELRNSEPYATQVIASAATTVVNGNSRFDSYKWWVAESSNGVVGIAMHTAPFNLFLSPMPVDAVEPLADLVLVEDPNFPGINGPGAITKKFVERCSQISSGNLISKVRQEHLAYVLIELKIPPRVVGFSRVASPKDFDLLLDWFRAFALEAEVDNHDVEVLVERSIKAERLYVWEADGKTVCMAGFTLPVPFPQGTLCRIGPVYTPLENRKRGFASFLVSDLCQNLQSKGHSIMLYADAKNSDSNRIYTKIGFTVVGSNSIWESTWR